MTPIFLFSLPRSGSTLVQRVLATHDEISTAAEPWLLLPQVFALRDSGLRSGYGARLAAHALEDFMAVLPGGSADYLEEVRDFALRLYEKASRPGARYFLDKTPRYHLIVEDIFRLFPEGRFLFVWRNPISVVSSIAETWTEGRWQLGRWKVDLFDGLANLVAAHERHAHESFAARYEDLVTTTELWRSLLRYLGLELQDAQLSQFGRLSLPGRMGDKVGAVRYRQLSAEPVERWRQTINNPYRREWCRRYLRWIGSERLSEMGYDLDVLLAELDGNPVSLRGIPRDTVTTFYGEMQRRWRMRGLYAPRRESIRTGRPRTRPDG